MKPKLLVLASVAALALLATGCDKLKARDNLNKGVAAFKQAKYSDAVEHFKVAVDLDPSWSMPRLYLATAYMSQYIPGADSPENLQNAKMANDQFLKVLEQDPKNATAVEFLASLHYNEAQGAQAIEQKMKKLDEARVWYEKLSQLDPNKKEAWYSLGVITWAKWYPALMTARAKLGMKPEDAGPIKDKALKEELKNQWGAQVDQGIANLQKAISIDPEYDDAMAYVNLLVREKADLDDSPEQYKKDIDTADGWVQKALEAKKIKADKAAKAPQGTPAPQ